MQPLAALLALALTEPAPPAEPTPSHLALTPSLRYAFAPGSAQPPTSHQAVGLAADYRVVPRLALGVTGEWFVPLESPPVGPSSHVVGMAGFDVKGVFVRSRTIEAFAGGGPGVVFSHPTAVVDTRRDFPTYPRLAFAATAGVNVAITPLLAAFAGVRATTYADTREATVIATTNPQSAETWYAGTILLNVLEAQLGVAFQVPGT